MDYMYTFSYPLIAQQVYNEYFYSYIMTRKSADVIHHSSTISSAGNLKDLRTVIVTKVSIYFRKI